MDIIADNFIDKLFIEDLKDIIGGEEITGISKFKSIFDLLPCGIEVLDHDGSLLLCNKAGNDIFGVEEGALANLNVFNDPNITDSILQEINSGVSFNFLLPYDFSSINYISIYESGIKYLSVRGIPLYAENQIIKGFFIVILDDTLNHQQHIMLEESLTKLQVAINKDNSVIWEYDVLNDHIYIDPLFNDCKNNNLLQFLSQISDLRKDELYTFVHPEDILKVRDFYVEPLLKGDLNQYTSSYRCIFDNETMWLRVNARVLNRDSSKKPVKIVFYATDITPEVSLEDSYVELEKESEQIIKAIPDLIFVISQDYSFHKVIASGSKFKRMNLSEKDFVGKIIDSYFDLEISNLFIKKINKALETKKEIEFEYSLNQDGEQRFFQSRISPLDNGATMHIIRDVTDKIKIKYELDMFAFAVSQSRDEIYAFDEFGTLVFANKLTIQNYGLASDFSSYSYKDMCVSCSGEAWELNRNYLRVNNSKLFESRHKLINGEEISVEISAYRTVNHLYGEQFWFFSRDISSRIAQQDEINKLNAIMNIVLSNVPIVVAVKNIVDEFKYIYFNAEAEVVMKRSAEDIIEKTDFDLFPDQAWAEEIRRKDEKAVRDGSLSEYAVNYKDPTGRVRVVNALRIRVDSNNNSFLVVMLWDITEQHNNQLELIKSRESDRLKTAFLHNISHEIRTPLNAIIGFSSIVGEASDKFEHDYYVSIINENSDLLLKLINDVVDLSSSEADKFDYRLGSVDIKDICLSVYEMFSPRIKPEVQFIFERDKLPSIFIFTDSKRLIQVLSNVIDNAIKFTNNGFIRFWYELNDITNSGKRFVSIFIQDSGIGIDKNFHEALFERFFKADNFTQGFGLGLPIAKKITEEMGGELTFVSNIGEGSTFCVKIPILQ